MTASASDRDAIKFDNHISGPTLTQADLEGKIVVAHQWQAHWGGCPSSLKVFEKIARRKKTKPIVFQVWHSADSTDLAKKNAKDLKLKLPIYHGNYIKFEAWPNVLIFDGDGKIIYNGKPDKKFERALNKAVRDMKK